MAIGDRCSTLSVSRSLEELLNVISSRIGRGPYTALCSVSKYKMAWGQHRDGTLGGKGHLGASA